MIASVRLTVLLSPAPEHSLRSQSTGYTIRNSTYAKRRAPIMVLCLATDLPYESRDLDKQRADPKSSEILRQTLHKEPIGGILHSG